MRAFGLLVLPAGGVSSQPSPPYLSVTPLGSSEVVLVNGTAVSGYAVLASETSLGDVIFEQAEGAPVGMLGASVVTQTPVNRQATIAVVVEGATADEFASRVAVLESVVFDLAQRGGRVSYRKWGQALPMRTHLRVLAASITQMVWGDSAERRNRAVFAVNLTCAPLVEGDAAYWSDPFEEDGFATGTWVVGSGSQPTIANGFLRPNGTAEARLIAVGPGYTYGDVEVELSYTPAGASGIKVGAMLRAKPGSENTDHLLVTVDQAGTVAIEKRVAGSLTSLATAAGAALVAGTRYWIRARVRGNVVVAEVFTRTSALPTAPTDVDAATTTATAVLSASDAARFYSGRVGLHLDPAATGDVIDVFRYTPTARSSPMPTILPFRGVPAGSADGRYDVDVAVLSTIGRWGLVAWSAFDDEPNLCPNGNFAQASSPTAPWVVSALSGFSNAASSISRVTAAGRYDNGVGQIVTPGASADQGARCPLATRFYSGQFVLATGWLRAASGVQPAYLRVGTTGDIASSQAGGRALSTAWSFHAALWQPTANRSLVSVGANVATTTAQTFQIDAVCVCETVPVPLAADPGSSGTTFTLESGVPAEWPEAPFLAVVEPGTAATELVLVTAAATGATTITAVRGMDGTPAGAHAAGVTVCPVPDRARFEGGGGPAPFGAFEATQVATTGTAPSVTTSVEFTQGTAASVTAAGAGSTTYMLTVDPGVLPRRADAAHRFVEVYVPMRFDTGLVDLTVTAWVSPVNVASWPGAYSAEFGSLGVRVAPAASDDSYTTVFAGTLAMPDRGEGYVFVKVEWGVGSTETVDVDDFILVPAATRAATLEGAGIGTPWGSATTRRVHADLTGRGIDSVFISAWGDDVRRAWDVEPLGGAPLEPAPAAKHRWLVFNGPVPNGDPSGAEFERLMTLRLYPTPRWGRLRDA